MKSDNIYKKLRFIALCLAIVCMVLSLIKRAKAESMNTTIKDYCTEYLNTYIKDYDVTIFETACSECEFFSAWSFTDTNNNTYYVLDLYTDKNIGGGYCQFGSSSAYNRFINLDSTYTSNGWVYGKLFTNSPEIFDGSVTVYRFCSNKNNVIACISKYTGDSMYHYSTGAYGGIDVYLIGSSSSDYQLLYGSSYYSNFSSFNYIGSYGNVYLQKRGNYDVQFESFEDSIVPITKNTDGLKVYKQTIHNTSYLYIDYSDCINIVPTYLETSSVFGNIDIDGTIYEIDYNSSTQYYHINIGTGKVYYQIPFSSLSLNDDNIESAVLNDLEISVSWSTTLSQGNESLFWVTPIYLIGSPHDAPGYTPDSSNEQPQQTYTPEMNTEYYLEIYSMYNDGHTGNPFKYDDNLNLYSSHQLALNSIKMQADVVEIDTWYISTVDKELYASNTDLFGDYIYDNGFGLFYDAIVFDVYDRHVDGVVNPVNIYKGTGVLYTEKYYTRNGLNTLTDSLKDVIQYDKMCSDYLYLLYDVTWKKLKSIDYNIADYFTKQGNVTSQIILILENINSFLPDIKGILDDILDALKNLQLSQLDAIDSKLTTIIDNISTPNTPFNEDDTVAEAIKYYESHNNNGVPTGQVYIDDKMSIWISGKVHLWLQGTDANTDKTNLINSVFETLTSIYDSMKNNNDIFPNIQYYLDAIAKNNNYGYETHGDYMTRFFKGNVDISTYDGISE